MALEFEGLTEQIIGAAIEVHRRLGPGFLESIYENALVVELRKRDLHVQQQVPVLIRYDDVVVGEHRVDLLVGRKILIENKTVKGFDDIHFVIARSYLRALGLRHGLLLNFARTTLQVKRVRSDPV